MRKLLLLFFISSAILFAQWIPQNSNTTVALNTVFFTDSVTGIVAGNGGTILKTTDGGVNWIQKSSGTTRDIQSLKFFDANLGFAAGKFIILKTTDGGNTWNSVYYNTTSLLNDITFIDSLTWISVGASAELPDMKILKTTNCGLSWNLIIQGDVSLNAVCFTGINGLAAGWDGRIYKSTDSGDTWSQVVSGTSYQLFCVYNINPDDAIAAGFEILKSTNGGTSWTPVYVPSMAVFHSISFADLYAGVAVGAQGVNNHAIIMKTTDRGLHWIEETNYPYLTPGLTDVHFVNTNEGFAVGYEGTILYINNAGLPVELSHLEAEVISASVNLKWSTQTETNNRGFEIERNYEDGNWVLRSFVPGAGTTTEKKDYSYIDEPELSGKYSYRLKQLDYDGNYKYSDPVTVDFNYTPCYSLEQNYPNPFNPVTKISYSIPVYSIVSLKIFDALGREVEILVDEEKPAGEYSVEFNGSHLSSGVYICRMKTGEFILSRKMVCLK